MWQDFATYWRGELVGKKFRRPRGRDFVIFWGGKTVFMAFAFVIPSLIHHIPKVLGTYLFMTGPLGLILGLILQVAHYWHLKFLGSGQ